LSRPPLRVRLPKLHIALGLIPLVLVPLAAGGALTGINNYVEAKRTQAIHLETLGTHVNNTAADMGWLLAEEAPHQTAALTLNEDISAVDGDLAVLQTDDPAPSAAIAQMERASAAYVNTVGQTIRTTDTTPTPYRLDPQWFAATQTQRNILSSVTDNATASIAGDIAAAERAQLAVLWAVVVGMTALLAVLLRHRRRTEISHARERALKESEHHFRLIYEQNPLPMWSVDPSTLRFRSANQAAIAAYGYSNEEFLAMNLHDIQALDGNASQDGPAAAGHGGPTLAKHRLRDGSSIEVELMSDEVQTASGLILLIAARDVTHQRRLEAELHERAFHDALTGLANRALLEDRFGHAQATRVREDTGLALIALDLDGFKVINDTSGHAVGDEVLVAVSHRLLQTVRPYDTVSRVGGDEFALLIERVDETTAVDLAGRLVHALSEAVEVSAGRLVMSASLGVTMVPRGMPWETAMRNADMAMYVAKNSGKSCFRVYKPGIHSGVAKRLALRNDLQRALANEELSLHYQPILTTKLNDSEQKVEALLRWTHPKLGSVPPGDFIPIAEEGGLIVPLGGWVLNTACRQVAAWRSKGRPITVSVNVSGRQLQEPDFAETVLSAVNDAGIDERNLILELTETAILKDLAGAQSKLAELRSHGVRVALDDFGAGYSSLAYLSELPVDEVKIDRMFVVGLDDPQRRSTVVTIVRLLDALGVHTVAEGVETEEQLAYLLGMGIQAYQGFLFSHPVQATDVRRALEGSADAFARLRDSAATAA